jgi:hypothetical protein
VTLLCHTPIHTDRGRKQDTLCRSLIQFLVILSFQFVRLLLGRLI